jgi:hypothetical protein
MSTGPVRAAREALPFNNMAAWIVLTALPAARRLESADL